MKSGDADHTDGFWDCPGDWSDVKDVLKLEAVSSSETSVPIYQTVSCQTSKDRSIDIKTFHFKLK